VQAPTSGPKRVRGPSLICSGHRVSGGLSSLIRATLADLLGATSACGMLRAPSSQDCCALQRESHADVRSASRAALSRTPRPNDASAAASVYTHPLFGWSIVSQRVRTRHREAERPSDCIGVSHSAVGGPPATPSTPARMRTPTALRAAFPRPSRSAGSGAAEPLGPGQGRPIDRQATFVVCMSVYGWAKIALAAQTPLPQAQLVPYDGRAHSTLNNGVLVLFRLHHRSW